MLSGDKPAQQGFRGRMELRCIPVSEARDWYAALDGLQYAFGHCQEYCHAMEISSKMPVFLLSATDGDRKLACPFSIRERRPGLSDLVSPYGFAGMISNFEVDQETTFFVEWFDFCRDRGFVTAYVMQHPSFPLTGPVWREWKNDHHTLLLLDLALPEEQVWQHMHKTHRYEIRKQVKDANVHMVTDVDRMKDAVKRLYKQTLERVEAADVYRFPDNALDLIMNAPGGLLVGVEDQDGIQAVSLFLHTGGIAEYFLNASSDIGRMYSRTILWSAIVQLQKLMVNSLNMGGGVKPGDSLEMFKRRFGARAMNGQVLKIIFDREKYAWLCEQFGVQPDQRGFFPPYWAPGIR